MIDVQLRELEQFDLSLINMWRNDPEIIRLLGANFLFINTIIDDRWFESYLISRASNVRLAIIIPEIDRCIGLVNLTNIHAINRTAEFSIMLGDKNYWSQGIGYQATSKILNHGLYDLNLNRIYLTVLASNNRARRLYQRLGFQEEGVQRSAVYKDGKFCDVISMALLKSDFHVNE
jgi:RimJ/RimL family protein N-acetyltransferase